MSDFVDELVQRVDKAARTGQKLRPLGGGTKDFYGGPLEGEPISLAAHQGIVEYEPTELVMTVKAGTLLSEVEAALAAHQQELAFEPPRMGAGSTIGGAVLAGLAGPARLARGPVKDYLLGCTLLDGRAQVLHFGGVVMKNVAGYDVSRLLAGSLGTLGIALDLSIKVMPKAVSETTLCFDWEQAQALSTINQWLASPLPVNASAWHQGQLWVRLRGARAAVDSAVSKLGGQVIDPATASPFWNSLRDQTHPFFAQASCLWRLAVPPTAPALNWQGPQLIEWGGGQRWCTTDTPEQGLALREQALSLGGHATLYKGGQGQHRCEAFTSPSPVMMNLQRRLKQQFDPAGIFSMGRLAPIV